MIQYEITSPKPSYAPLEPVQISLRIVNKGSAAVDLPNPDASGPEPVFLLSSPGDAQPAAVTAADLHPPSPFVAPPPARIHLAPGAEWRGSVSIPAGPAFGPGEHKIVSRLGSAESAPLAVTVEKLTPTLAAAGFGVEPQRAADGQLLLLHRGRALYKTRYTESRPSIAETRIDPLSLVAVFDAPLSGIGLPLRAGAFYDEAKQWMVWRQPGQVHLRSSTGDSRLATVPANVVRLSQPPLKRAGAPVHIVTVADSPAEATLLLFPAAAGATAEPAWTLPLEAPAANVATALGAAAADGHVAAVSATPKGVLVQHVHYTGFRIPEAFNSVNIPGCRPVPGAAIGIDPRPDGSARLGLFVISEGASHSVSFVELLFPPGQSGSIASTVPLGAFAAPPTASAVHYFTPAGAAQSRRAALLAVPGKGLLRLEGPALSPVSVQGQPTEPILLVPGKDVTFVVYLRPNGAPYLEPI